MSHGSQPSAETLAFAADTPPGVAGEMCRNMARVVEAIDPGCTSWVEIYVARLTAALAFLTGRGMRPERANPTGLIPYWKVPVPGWHRRPGETERRRITRTYHCSNDELVAFATAEGFDG